MTEEEINSEHVDEQPPLDYEAILHSIAEQMMDVLYAIDNRGFIIFISPSVRQMFGWTPEDIVGRSFIEFLPEPEIPGAVTQFKEAVASGQKMRNLAYVMKRADGSRFPAELSSSILRKDGCAVGRIGMIRDITERKRAEEELRESEERYRNQVESINDVAYALGKGGEITYISPVVRNVLGYEPSEIIGRHFLELMYQEDHDLLKRKFSELREGIVSHSEYRVVCKNGEAKWVRTQTRPIINVDGFAGGRGVLMDITERKRAEDALRRAEENFHRSLNESPLGVRIVTAEGETLYANRAFLAIHGYDTIEELIKTPVQERYTAASYAEFLLRREKRRQGADEAPLGYTLDIIRKNGEVRHLQVFRKIILWDGERQFQVIYNDITEQKRAEAAVQKRLKELNCLYGISALMQRPGISLDEVLQQTVALIPSAWQFPEIAAARIVLGNQIFRTARFRETPWMLCREIIVNGKPAGQIMICYLEERPTIHEGPFVIDERYLLNAIAEQLGRIIEQLRAEEKLDAESRRVEETNTALRVLLKRVKEDQHQIEASMMANIQKLVLPHLERLRTLKLNESQANCLDVVVANLMQVTAPFLMNLTACFADFTPREVQVAQMIREGKTSKEIAAYFNSSIRSVEFHRDNIRKKLGLNRKKSNLRTFLMQLSEK